MDSYKPRIVPKYQPLGKLIGAARETIEATQEDLASTVEADLDQVKTLEKGKRPYLEIAEDALRYVPVDLDAAEMALDAEIEGLLGQNPISRVVAKEAMLTRLRAFRTKGYLRARVKRTKRARILVPRDGFEPPTRGSSDRCSMSRFALVLRPQQRRGGCVSGAAHRPKSGLRRMLDRHGKNKTS